MSDLTDDFQKLLTAALSMNDALCVEVDHASFTGSMSQAEDFRQLVNQLWHKHNPKRPRAEYYDVQPPGDDPRPKR